MIRRLTLVLAVAAATLTACSPPPDPVPTAVATIGVSGLPAERASFVTVSVTTANFQAPAPGSPLSVAVKVLDAVTGGVVEDRTVDLSGSSGLVVAVPISGFEPDSSTLDGRIHPRAVLTVTQTVGSGGVLTATSSDDRVIDWTQPTSPYDGVLTPHDPPNYQLTDILAAFCGPVGRTIHVTSPDTPDPLFVAQAIPGNNFSNPVTIPAGGGDVTFATVTACVVLSVNRASFTGGLTGVAHFTVEF